MNYEMNNLRLLSILFTLALATNCSVESMVSDNVYAWSIMQEHNQNESFDAEGFHCDSIAAWQLTFPENDPASDDFDSSFSPIDCNTMISIPLPEILDFAAAKHKIFKTAIQRIELRIETDNLATWQLSTRRPAWYGKQRYIGHSITINANDTTDWKFEKKRRKYPRINVNF